MTFCVNSWLRTALYSAEFAFGSYRFDRAGLRGA
jgi:hypothetical protein